MNSDRHETARKLAARPYVAQILRDDSVPGEPLYVALNPELEGCMAQGESVEEAIANLAEFRVDYIEHLLEHRLPIPDPATIPATITGIVDKESVIRVQSDPHSGNLTEVQDEESQPGDHEGITLRL